MKINLNERDLSLNFRGTDPEKVTFEMLNRSAQIAVRLSSNGAIYEGYSRGTIWKKHPWMGSLYLGILIGNISAAIYWGPRVWGMAGPLSLLAMLGFLYVILGKKKVALTIKSGESG